ncbi:MAG: branched-chain amino acid ABC transporter permease [Deltaproteobacteria bacterium]|nr:branched-chain amino acid ABC transporter permease [Deltaproteobacteria bacterium]
MDILIQAVLDGICVGAIYGIGAMGLVVIQKSSGVFNMAQGMLMMFGAFVAAKCALGIGMPMWLSVVSAMLLAGILGLVIDLIVMRPLAGESPFTQLMATIGLLSILYGIIMITWGTYPYVYPTEIIPTGNLEIGDISVSSTYLNGFILGVASCVGLTLFYKYSKEGIAMRATSEDEELAASTGIRVTKVLRMSWVLGAGCAALSGVLFGGLGSVSYMLGDIGLLAIIPVMVFGGLESFVGALLAGLIVGVVTMMAGTYLEVMMPGIMHVVPLVVMLLVLIFKPYGLFGEERIERI